MLSLSSAREYAHEKMRLFDMEGLAEDGLFLRREQFYLVGTYPPLKALPPINAQNGVTADAILSNVSSKLNLYAHFPFCEQHCGFCHFAKEINADGTRVSKYLRALVRQIEMMGKSLPDRKALTLFFGGGTRA